ncbi:MAG: DNA polymerase III subunit gamma/tau [Patescibacteria group bacterium]
MDTNSAFYLKYRPQAFDQLVGQETVKKSLSDAFKSNRLSHAYLFVGPRGTGKTSTARILAKMVNCESVDVPCNKCSTCISITDGSNLDLIEIDAASNRGIEDIRSLREKIKLAPTSSKKKVYIIDEVHMLTTEAFNALLKTLEEPPKHALFILATTDAQKIPQTIVSRSTRLDFSLASLKDLKEALDKIIKVEKIDIDSDALTILMKKADGSFRDGIKMLDQVASKDGKINAKDIIGNFRSISFDNLEQLLQNFSANKTSEGLMKIQKLIDFGADVKEVLSSLMDLFRNLMFIKNGLGENLVKPNLTSENYERLTVLAEKFENKQIVRNLEILQKAMEQLKFTTIQSLPLELAVVEMTQSVILSPKDEGSLARLVSDESERANARSETSSEILRFAQNDKEEIVVESTAKPVSVTTSPSDSPDIAKLKEKWTFVLETIRPYNFSLEALLRSVRVSSITDVNVIMEVPYSFHQRILEAPKNRDILEGVLSDILGRQIRVSCVLGTRPMRKEEIANIEIAEDDDIIRVASEIFNSESVN